MATASKPHGATAPGFRADVEGLRAIAILFVALYHAGLSLLPGGFVGVDIFFVVSGFLITSLLVREIETSGTVNFIIFYARRTRRLLPAAACMVIFTLIAAQFVYAPQELVALAKDAVTTSLYASNLWFAHISTDYLAADAAKSPLLHTWSLSVEEQFYMVWPLFILLAMRGSKDAAQRRKRLLVAMTVLATLSLALSLWLTKVAQPWAFFASPTRAWEFAVGGLASQIPAVWIAARPRMAQGGFWFGLLLIGIAGTCYSHGTTFPGVAALVPVLGTALMLTCHIPGRFAVQMLLLNNPVMQWIGSRSYSWYLWHWPVLVLAGIVNPAGKGLLQGMVCLALSLLLSELSCRVIENPVRFSSLLSRRPAYSLAMAVIITLVCAGSSQWWRYSGGREATLPAQMKFTRAMSDIPNIIYDSNCHLDFMEIETGDCVFGDVNSATTIVLFGDSHAAQWFPAMEALAREHNWRLVSYTKSACPIASLETFNSQLGRTYSECSEWRGQVMKKIVAMRPALVVMGYFAGYVQADDDDPDTIDGHAWQQGMHDTFTAFEPAGINVAVMRDSPHPGFNVPLCLARQAKNAWMGATCDYSREHGLDSVEYKLARNAAANMKNINFIDLSQRICTSEKCSPTDGDSGIVLFRDSHHLTTEYVRHLMPELKIELARVMQVEPQTVAAKTL